MKENTKDILNDKAKLDQRNKIYRESKYEWDERVNKALVEVFGHKNGFRENQKEIINAVMSGRDVMGLIPTGGGKSLTFQIPAVLNKGVTIVIMPLISLIMDQCQFCDVHRIPYIDLSSNNKAINGPGKFRDALDRI